MRTVGQVIGLKPDQIEVQVPLETRAPGEWWTTIKEVFHTD
jgi:hypothetical protein